MGGKDNYEDLTEMNGFSPHDDEKSVRSTKSTESEKETKAVGVAELFKFSDRTDVLFLLVGALAALLGGMMYPLNIYLFGDLTNDFVMSAREDDNSTKSAIIFKELTEKASTKAIYLCILGVSSYILSALQNFFWCYIAERQVRKIRKLLFDSILRQDVSWFDLQKRGELSARYSEDIHKIKEGMGVKVGMFLRLFITFSGVGVIAIILNWKLALAALSFSPVMVVTQAICAKVLRSISETESKAYAGAGAIAEESISAIRTVTAFGGQEKQYTRYSENLNVVEKVVLRKGFLLGLCVSVHWSSMFFLMAVSFWYGTTLFQEGGYRPGDIIMVFFGVLLGSILLGEALPSIEVFATARGAAANVYRIIDLQPSINAYYEKGEKLKNVRGTLQIKGATFRYPSRPEVSVLHGTTFDIPSGQRVALVGASGSGKSTILQLLLRLHDPDKGQILLDGKDIKTLNLKWYRDQIGVVGQEPVLFDTTIADNIRYGRADVTQDEIEAAAKEANAHKFITNLPDKYNTIVGGRGQRLSGGQKQRVAIARALVKNPRFLFLDEATSALDNENEVLVQKALDLAQAGRTTLIIAHRLSTIKNADKIIVLDNGEIKEVGTHSELMENESHYYRLVMKQAAEEDKLENELSNHSISEGIQRMISTASDVKIEIDQDKVKHENHDDGGKVNGIVMRLLKLNSKEWMYIIPGCLASLVTGAVLPSLAFLFSEFLKILAIHDKKSQMDQTKIVAAVDMGIAILLFLAHLIKMLSFVVSGSRLTLRLRKIGFRSILGQDISFFDEPGNQVGNLTTRLSTDASIVHGATGSKIGAILETLTTVTCMLVIAFFYSWKLSLVVFSFFPLILFSGIIQGKFVKGNQSEDAEFIAEAGNVYTQVIDNITTVTSLNAQPQFKKKYDSIVDTLYSKGKKHAITEGITFAFSACIIYFVYAGSLRYGAELVKDGEIEFHNVFRILVVILFGGFAIGREGSYTPDFVKAKVAAQRLFSLIDRVPRIDPYSKSGTIPKTCTGEVYIQNLHFRYPSRPDALILKDMSLNIRTGKTVALVGQSGCGKSTVVQLLERFYDIDSGTISLDQVNITSLNISWLRSQIGVVSQEPVLFDCSIAENIAYGNNSRDVTMAEIIESARSANIHSFIDALPQGYETNVGARGTQLSGGQKQRVAIARVMVRNPKILLLDEATSALDTESEKIVQKAIDRATEGRTCIVIAHRLSTIINADQIAVINNGQIEEVGSHSELIAKQGKYYNLYKLKGNNDVHS